MADDTALALTHNEIESNLLALPQVECPIAHHFGGSIYMREMSAPAGTVILGHEHKHPHMCVLLKGSMRVQNENGTTSDLTAPLTFEAKPGRKLALTLTDVVFLNVHPNEDEERDITKLEERWITKSEGWTAQQLTAATKVLTGEL